ncbi:hypothetical protein BUE80_DR006634, partial [Diplocarpon rosae]
RLSQSTFRQRSAQLSSSIDLHCTLPHVLLFPSHHPDHHIRTHYGFLGTNPRCQGRHGRRVYAGERSRRGGTAEELGHALLRTHQPEAQQHGRLGKGQARELCGCEARAGGDWEAVEQFHHGIPAQVVDAAWRP